MAIKTKIICTMGPAVRSREKITELVQAGMNVARLNFSHGTHAEHLAFIHLLKEVRKELGVPLAIMLDTKGPEIRVGSLTGGEISIEEGDQFTLVPSENTPIEHSIPISPSSVLSTFEVGASVLFDDGYISARVIEKKHKHVLIVFENRGILKSNKGVNVPTVDTKLPAMTEKDIEDIRFGCTHGIDIIAASFVRSSLHILEIKRLLVELSASQIMVLAKIESQLGVENFDEILEVADGILIARGDLGVELPLEQVPILQKMMIRKCNQASKPVVTATQMLESMTKNPRPTRAEVSDVANAIYDSTSAIMLSGETAAGLYPIEAVKTMYRIANVAEHDCNYKALFKEQIPTCDYLHVALSVALSSVQTAYSSGAVAIFALTDTGLTARFISRFRPSIPIIAQTSREGIYHQLSIYWGVLAPPPASFDNAKEAIAACSRFALERGLIRCGDLAVVIAGSLFGVSGMTNIMMLENIGDVLVRGNAGLDLQVTGKVLLLSDWEKNGTSPAGKILVLTHCNQTMESIFEKSLGIILQNHHQDAHSEQCAMDFAKKFKLPIITRASGACQRLHSGMWVTMDAGRGLIFKEAR